MKVFLLIFLAVVVTTKCCEIENFLEKVDGQLDHAVLEPNKTEQEEEQLKDNTIFEHSINKKEEQSNKTLPKQKKLPDVVIDPSPPKGPRQKVLIKQKLVVQYLEEPLFNKRDKNISQLTTTDTTLQLTTDESNTTDATSSDSTSQEDESDTTPTQSTHEITTQHNIKKKETLQKLKQKLQLSQIEERNVEETSNEDNAEDVNEIEDSNSNQTSSETESTFTNTPNDEQPTSAEDATTQSSTELQLKIDEKDVKEREDSKDDFSENHVVKRKKRTAFISIDHKPLPQRYRTRTPSKKHEYHDHGDIDEHVLNHDSPLELGEVEYGRPKTFAKHSKNQNHVRITGRTKKKKPSKLYGANHYKEHSNNDEEIYNRDNVLELEISYPDIKHQDKNLDKNIQKTYKKEKEKTKLPYETFYNDLKEEVKTYSETSQPSPYLSSRLSPSSYDDVALRGRTQPPKISHSDTYRLEPHKYQYTTDTSIETESLNTMQPPMTTYDIFDQVTIPLDRPRPKTYFSSTVDDTNIQHKDTYHPDTNNPHKYHKFKPNLRKHHGEKQSSEKHHPDKHHWKNHPKHGEKLHDIKKDEKFHVNKGGEKHHESKHRQKVYPKKKNPKKQFFLQNNRPRPVSEHSYTYRTYSYKTDTRRPYADTPEIETTRRETNRRPDYSDITNADHPAARHPDMRHPDSRRPNTYDANPYNRNLESTYNLQYTTRGYESTYNMADTTRNYERTHNNADTTLNYGSTYNTAADTSRNQEITHITADTTRNYESTFNTPYTMRNNESSYNMANTTRNSETTYNTADTSPNFKSTYVTTDSTRNLDNTHKTDNPTSQFPSTKDVSETTLSELTSLLTTYHTSNNSLNNAPSNSTKYLTTSPIFTKLLPTGFGEPPEDYKYLDLKDSISESTLAVMQNTANPLNFITTRTPKIKEVRFFDQPSYDYIGGINDDFEGSSSVMFEYIYQDDNKDVYNPVTMPQVKNKDSILVGGKYAEPPGQLLHKRELFSRDYSSVFVSPYVNYKYSNMAFSPQNLNDAFSVNK